MNFSSCDKGVLVELNDNTLTILLSWKHGTFRQSIEFDATRGLEGILHDLSVLYEHNWEISDDGKNINVTAPFHSKVNLKSLFDSIKEVAIQKHLWDEFKNKASTISMMDKFDKDRNKSAGNIS